MKPCLAITVCATFSVLFLGACKSSEVSKDRLDAVPRDAPVDIVVAPARSSDGRGGYTLVYEAQNYLETKLAALSHRFRVTTKVNWNDVLSAKALGWEDYVAMDPETLQELFQGAEYLFVWDETVTHDGNVQQGNRSMAYNWELKAVDLGTARLALTRDGYLKQKEVLTFGAPDLSSMRRKAIEAAVTTLR